MAGISLAPLLEETHALAAAVRAPQIAAAGAVVAAVVGTVVTVAAATNARAPINIDFWRPSGRKKLEGAE